MPRFDNSVAMDTFQGTAGNYGFSGTRIENLGATEYTLVCIAIDLSGSTSEFVSEMKQSVKRIVQSLRSSPRADYLMLRVIVFADRLAEFHGFKPLSECNADDYDNMDRNVGAMTALYDATHNAADSIASYGKSLTEQDFDVNGILYILTDGMENQSSVGINTVKDAIKATVTGENVESCISILVGVNVDPGSQTNQWLDNFRQDADFDKYKAMGASADEFAKLAEFIVSQSVSQSQSLGSGGPSQVLAF